MNGSIPAFKAVPESPSPTLDDLPGFKSLTLTGDVTSAFDISGARRAALSEAIFLFHKCSHATYACQRMGYEGMHGMALFNAYHAAFFGARGILAMLGISFPYKDGANVLVDVFPDPSTKKKGAKQSFASAPIEIKVVKIHKFEQRHLWEALQRVVNVVTVPMWTRHSVQQIRNLDHDEITPPRNKFLYRAGFWPLDDLVVDKAPGSLSGLVTGDLDVSDPGFLLTLAFAVYQMFDALVEDLGTLSGPIQIQRARASQVANQGSALLDPFRAFEHLYV